MPEGGSEKNMSEDEDIVVLQDEEGNDSKFYHIMTFDFENSFYVALTPETEVDGIKNGEVLLLEIVEDEDGDDCYVPIEDEKKLDRVWEEFERLYNEEEDDDADGEGCGCEGCCCEGCEADEE
jgi:uncharacterized protein YrzB (UPF0473 family)